MNVPLSEKRPSIGKKALDRVKSVSLFHNTFIAGQYFLGVFFCSYYYRKVGTFTLEFSFEVKKD